MKSDSYSSPAIEVLGTLADLTQGQIGDKQDFCSTTSHNQGNGGCEISG